MAKQGPTKGSRILVELPSPLADEKKGNLISIKQGVATLLGFNPVAKIPRTEVTIKTAAGERKIERLRSGSYRRRQVTLYFEKPQTVKGSKGKYKSVSMPIPSGTSIADVVEYFSSGAGKNRKVAALKTPDGKRIQWGELAL